MWGTVWSPGFQAGAGSKALYEPNLTGRCGIALIQNNSGRLAVDDESRVTKR